MTPIVNTDAIGRVVSGASSKLPHQRDAGSITARDQSDPSCGPIQGLTRPETRKAEREGTRRDAAFPSERHRRWWKDSETTCGH